MNTLKHIATVAALALLPILAQAEAVGTWKAYMAYHDVTAVEQGGQTLYVLASSNLYSYNQNDQSIRTYDKVTGMNDCEVALIKWNPAVKKLLVVYANENIDLMDTDGNFSNLPDYYNKSLTEDKTVNSIYISGRYAYLSTAFGIIKIDMQEEAISDTYNLGFGVNYCYIEGQYIYAASAEQGTWRAALSDNLLDKSLWTRSGNYVAKKETIDPDLLAIVNTLEPGGPKYNNFAYMRFKNGKLYTAGGGYTAGVDRSKPGTPQVLAGDEWEIYEDDITEQTGHRFVSMRGIDQSPTNLDVVAVSGRTGLYEYKNGKLWRWWDSTNSPLVAAASRNYTLVMGCTYDADGNLWLANSSSTSTSLFELSPSGEWTDHHTSLLMNDGKSLKHMMDLNFDSNKNLWFVNNHYGKPALIYHKPSTDETIVYSSFVNEDGKTLTTWTLGFVLEDGDGNIWFGTDEGPLYIEPSNIGAQAEDMTFMQVKVPRNDGTNLADYLLSGIRVTCMAIDGAGRKWFGSEGTGVYLISKDNYTQLQHFRSNNSPLLSDNIQSIAINPTTGEVYIATDKGLCSYMSDAIDPVEEMSKDVTYAYPNPVTPDYTGLITVTGLTLDAELTICSSSGKLVAKGRSNGGMFTWDGCDLKGNRVASGVYMVQTATSSGEKGTVCKIAIVR